MLLQRVIQLKKETAEGSMLLGSQPAMVLSVMDEFCDSSTLVSMTLTTVNSAILEFAFICI